jgi:hypothetical protein
MLRAVARLLDLSQHYKPKLHPCDFQFDEFPDEFPEEAIIRDLLEGWVSRPLDFFAPRR